AELGFLLPEPCEVAVEIVGDRGGDEEDEREPVRPGPVEIEKHHRNAGCGEQAEDRQRVRDRPFHAGTLATGSGNWKGRDRPLSAPPRAPRRGPARVPP